MPRRALITGITGQDGSYLAELLFAEGIEVHGVRARAPPTRRRTEPGRGARRGAPPRRRPARTGHAAARSSRRSRPTRSTTSPRRRSCRILGRRRATRCGRSPPSPRELIEAVRDEAPAARIVIATSREIFGADAPSPQREDTPCAPSSPYGVAKLAAHQLVGLVRERDGLHLSSAILFNHESPRRAAGLHHAQGHAPRSRRSASAASDELVVGDTRRGPRLVRRRRHRRAGCG